MQMLRQKSSSVFVYTQLKGVDENSFIVVVKGIFRLCINYEIIYYTRKMR